MQMLVGEDLQDRETGFEASVRRLKGATRGRFSKEVDSYAMLTMQ